MFYINQVLLKSVEKVDHKQNLSILSTRNRLNANLFLDLVKYCQIFIEIILDSE